MGKKTSKTWLNSEVSTCLRRESKQLILGWQLRWSSWCQPGDVVRMKPQPDRALHSQSHSKRCPIASNLGLKYLFSDPSKGELGARLIYVGWTTAFCQDGVSNRINSCKADGSLYSPVISKIRSNFNNVGLLRVSRGRTLLACWVGMAGWISPQTT